MSLSQYFNQHSFTISAALALVLLAVWLFRDGVRSSDVIALAALAAGLTAAYLLFNPGSSTDSDPERLLARIGAGTPVLLEFQSPF